jgi:Helix-turn-helix domain
VFTPLTTAVLAGTSQPSLSNLLRGFSIERLMLMLTAFGRDVDVVVRALPGGRVGTEGLSSSGRRHEGKTRS